MLQTIILVNAPYTLRKTRKQEIINQSVINVSIHPIMHLSSSAGTTTQSLTKSCCPAPPPCDSWTQTGAADPQQQWSSAQGPSAEDASAGWRRLYDRSAQWAPGSLGKSGFETKMIVQFIWRFDPSLQPFFVLKCPWAVCELCVIEKVLHIHVWVCVKVNSDHLPFLRKGPLTVSSWSRELIFGHFPGHITLGSIPLPCLNSNGLCNNRMCIRYFLLKVLTISNCSLDMRLK